MTQDVFSALADPLRRQILHRLHNEGALSLNELAEPLTISRQAVTKHLEMLRAARLIRVERQGRERRHHIQLRSLKAVADWLQPYAKAWDDALLRLKHHLDEADS